MRRPRFRLRSLLMTVVAFALLIVAGVLRRRQEDYRGRAAFHERMAHHYKCLYRAGFVALTTTVRPGLELSDSENEEVRRWLDRFRDSHREPETSREDRTALAVILSERAVYHDLMGWKYRWAAAHPWLGVAPDPPPPE
jgi:hypothetical protein